MESKKPSLEELLKQAASSSLPRTPEEKQEEAYREEQMVKALEIVEEGKSKWEIIASKMEGDFAERFAQEMEALSGREFVRTYIKMLEYFHPKVVRVESKIIEKEDNVLKIEIMNSKPEETIDIEHEEPKDE
jgi:hypothetical protein